MNDFRSIFEHRYTWMEGFARNVFRFAGKPAVIDPEPGPMRNWTAKATGSPRRCAPTGPATAAW